MIEIKEQKKSFVKGTDGSDIWVGMEITYLLNGLEKKRIVPRGYNRLIDEETKESISL